MASSSSRLIIDQSIQSLLLLLAANSNAAEPIQHGNGLIIGQLSHSKTYLFHGVPTPPDPEATTRENWNLDKDWILNHVEQVDTMLVTGGEILGLYFCGDDDSLKRYEATFHSLIYSLSKTLTSIRNEISKANNSQPKDLVLLTFSTTVKKLVTTLFQFSPEKKFKIVDYVYQKLPSPISLCTVWPLKFSIIIDSKSDLKTQLLDSLLKQIDQLSSALGTINGEFVVPENMDKLLNSTSEINISLLLPGIDCQETVIPEDVKVIERWIQLAGSIHAKSYFIDKPTYSSALESIKWDITKSLKATFTVWFEDLTDSATDLSQVFLNHPFNFNTLTNQVWHLPRRVFINLIKEPDHSKPSSEKKKKPHKDTDGYILCLFCDYVLPKEEENYSQSVASRSSALLSLKIGSQASIVSLQSPVNLVGDKRGLVVEYSKNKLSEDKKKGGISKQHSTKQPTASTTSPPPNLSTVTNRSSNSNSTLIFFVAIVVVLFAIIAIYIS